jgi:hypothetical protein
VSGLIDIHTHWCQFDRDPGPVLAELEWLEGRGYEALAVFPLPGMGAPPERVLDLIPGSYRALVDLNLERAAHDDLTSWRQLQRRWRERPGPAGSLELLSFLDARAWDGRTELAPWWGGGHHGLKGILIAEEDQDAMAMPPLRHVQGLSRAGYLEAQRALFAAAAGYGVPLVYHADLRFHGGFVAECLEAHPGLAVNIPHFGFSRRAMAGLLRRFPAVVTDISSLGPHMDAAPDAYRGFILDHPDRVLLGSDVLAGHGLRPALAYAERVRGLDLPAEVQAAVLGGNARRFLARG